MTPAMTRRLYVTAWLMLGAIALVYFFTLFQSFGGPKDTTASAPASAPALFSNKAIAPADPAVSQALARMRDEIDRLKASLEGANKENAALKAHVGTLEAAFGQSTTAALPREPKPMEAGEKKEEKSAQSTPAPKVEITMLPMPGDGFASDGLPGSPLPISGQSEPTRTLFAVELAKGLKPDEVAKRWKWLKLRHDKLLGQLKPRSVKVLSGNRSKGGGMTLVAGPFSNAAAAARLCARLIAAGAKCKGTIFAGSPVGGVASR
ncbi:hypothetical protein BMS3Bbin10_02025 [bacterium BMS3Bbin10]|nr:hypothetical protein BMS3Bbin10_02025 [bacterium BMS3Bbin10]HDL16884.1 hypothetical protein [Hyphomicrobiales bacterium]